MSAPRLAILLVMQDVRLRDIYLDRFEREGWMAEAASSLTDAERRAVQLRPAVMFLHSSYLDNISDSFKRLRALPTLLKTAIVVANTRFDRQVIEDLFLAGADDVVITTHITPMAFVKRMHNLIQVDV